jgi:hypothetical protein
MSGDQEQIRFLESVILTQRQLQRLQLGLAFAVFGLGVVCVILAQWLGGALLPDGIKQLGSLGGGFIASLSSFPLKQLYDRRHAA